MDPKSLNKRDKPYSVSSKKFYLNKNDKTDHWVEHSKLKELDTIDLFEEKQSNEEMEAELTECSEMDSKTDHLAVPEEANHDEDIPIDLKNEQNTQVYKDTIYIDIENISIFENRNKVNTIKWTRLYEDIDEAYFIGSKHFSDYFMQQCKDNANEAQFIPPEIKIT